MCRKFGLLLRPKNHVRTFGDTKNIPFQIICIFNLLFEMKSHNLNSCLLEEMVVYANIAIYIYQMKIKFENGQAACRRGSKFILLFVQCHIFAILLCEWNSPRNANMRKHRQRLSDHRDEMSSSILFAKCIAYILNRIQMASKSINRLNSWKNNFNDNITSRPISLFASAWFVGIETKPLS